MNIKESFIVILITGSIDNFETKHMNNLCFHEELNMNSFSNQRDIFSETVKLSEKYFQNVNWMFIFRWYFLGLLRRNELLLKVRIVVFAVK